MNFVCLAQNHLKTPFLSRYSYRYVCCCSLQAMSDSMHAAYKTDIRLLYNTVTHIDVGNQVLQHHSACPWQKAKCV